MPNNVTNQDELLVGSEIIKDGSFKLRSKIDVE